jgi:hypothetical protein
MVGVDDVIVQDTNPIASAAAMATRVRSMSNPQQWKVQDENNV